MPWTLGLIDKNDFQQSSDNEFHFAFLGDSPNFPVEDSPLGHHRENFQKILSVLKDKSPKLDFITFLGDHVWGYTDDKVYLQNQWREWLQDFKAIENYKVYQITGNHTVYDEMSTTVYKETFPHIPQNGPLHQKGLYYYERKGDLLLIFLNTAYQDEQKEGKIDYEWVDEVLGENNDAKIKLVFGHHPAHHVNGYSITGWRIWEEYAQPFWEVLVKHQVKAYICAHIIAFDVQVHQNILQITSAGAGFPSLYPKQTEYLHYTKAFVNRTQFSLQTITLDGNVKDKFTYPFLPKSIIWEKLSITQPELPHSEMFSPKPMNNKVLFGLRFKSSDFKYSENEQTLIGGFRYFSSGYYVWIGIVYNRLIVKLPVGGAPNPPVTWKGDILTKGSFDFQIIFHTQMGPGGVMYQDSKSKILTSLYTESAMGLEHMEWPDKWTIGYDHTGINFPDHAVEIVSENNPYLGNDLEVYHFLEDRI